MGSGAGGIYSDTYGYNQGLDVRAERQRQASSAVSKPITKGSEPKNGEPTRSDSNLLADNARRMRDDFDLQDNGYFAREGSKPHIRVFESSDPLKDSKDFFNRISAGGKDVPESKVDALRKLPDGTRINYRQVTKTPNSPAVQISRSKTDVVKNQKIHFINGARP